MSHTILTRLSSSPFSSHEGLSPLQGQVDSLVTHFVEEAANPVTLASLTAGGLAYRWGRVGVMGSKLRAYGRAPLQFISVATGLVSEVTAFEFTNRTIQTVGAHGRAPVNSTHPNHWSWSGPGGWQQSLLSSAVTFGMLRGAGHLARGQNIVFQHAFQSTAMVAGHQATARMGITPRPEGDLAQQFLHAEATNLQMGAGMALVHSMAPGLHARERSLDLLLQSQGFTPPGSRRLSSSVEAFRERPLTVTGIQGEIPFNESQKGGPILMMASKETLGGGTAIHPARGEGFSEALRIYQKEMNRALENNIERHRASWMGVMVPAPAEISDLIDRVIRRAQGYFGEKTLQVIFLKREGSPDGNLLTILSKEFGEAQVGPLVPGERHQKRILVTTPALVVNNLRFLPQEKSALLLIEEASDIFSSPVQNLVTHFRLGINAPRSGLKSKRGNGMVIGFSATMEGLGGFRLSSPKELPQVLPRISAPPPPLMHTPPPLPPPSIREASPVKTEDRPATSVTIREPFARRERNLIPPPKGPDVPAVKIPPPTVVPPPVRPVWPPPSPPGPPPPRSVWDPSPIEEAKSRVVAKKGQNQAVVIHTTPTVTPDMQKRIDAFWKALHEARAQESKGQTVNPFKVAQRAWQIYLETLPPEEKKVLEHNYLQSLANLAPDDRIVGIVQFLSEIGVRKRTKLRNNK